MKPFYSSPIIILMFLLLGCATGNSKQHIVFKPVSENEFSFPADSSFAVPHGKIWDERKKIHDSCMGSSYAVNAVFIRTKDTFLLGSIVDMKTMKPVKVFDPRNFGAAYFSAASSFTTKPCYERAPLEIPIDSLMNNSFVLKLDSSSEKINAEVMDAIKNSVFTEVETGSWLNMELNDGWGRILDTTTNAELLEYKKLLLTPGNLILVRSSSITEISFYFHTKKPMSAVLQSKLKEKPVVIGQPYFRLQLFYLDNSSFQLKLNGLFQMAGQFMKAETE
ncbi:MAG TPA: hypothetical protein PKM63_16640 [Panacibacter sp.]|nr:hypothetical protein [Panacibacter sp.]HNP45921.1 hypothetical protein [Panacibacter sp.]